MVEHMLLNMSASFAALILLWLCPPELPCGEARTRLRRYLRNVFCDGGRRLRVGFEKLEVGYHDFIQLFLNRVVCNMLFIVRLMYEGLVPIWNVVVVVLLDFFFPYGTSLVRVT